MIRGVRGARDDVGKGQGGRGKEATSMVDKLAMASCRSSQFTYETVMYDVKGGSCSVMWDLGWSALISGPTAYPRLTSVIISPCQLLLVFVGLHQSSSVIVGSCHLHR